ncbi:MAG: hypothetical protein AAF290_14435 [Pseudomonadota bacterium]
MRHRITIAMYCTLAACLKTAALAGERPVQPLYDYDLAVTNGQSYIHLSVHPRAPIDSRVVINSSDDDRFLDDFIASIKRSGPDALTNVWCDQFKAKIPETSAAESMPDGRQLYRFRPVAGPEDNANVYEHLEAAVILSSDDEQILSFEMGNTKTFKPSVAAKIRSFEYRAVCSPLTDGKTALESLTISVTGSAFFRPFTEFLQRRYSGFRISRATPLGSP